MNNFFYQNKEKIRGFVNDNINKNNNLSELLDYLLEITNKSMFYDKSCQFNIQHIGSTLIDAIEAHSLSEELRDDILIFLIRIAKEYDIQAETSLDKSGRKLLERYKEKSENYSDILNSQIEYTFNRMPYNILKEDYQERLNNVYDTLNNRIEETSKILDERVETHIREQLPQVDKDIKELKSYIDNAKAVLSEQKQRFSFVLLNKAFNLLDVSKNKSRRFLLFILFILAGLIIGIPIEYYRYQEEIIKHTVDVLSMPLLNNELLMYIFSLLPAIALESIIIYFFKIVLNKYDSVEDQIIQLETKQAVIQFIESYVEFKQKHNIEEGSLDKFENIVFSKISPNLREVPDVPNIINIIENLSKIGKK